MRLSTLASTCLLAGAALFLVAPARAREAGAEPPAQKGDTIAWATDLAQAFERATAQKKPVMICINSVRVDGGKVEPAAEGLREVVYRDLRIVTKSRAFVCVFLTSEGSSGDYGELRMRFGIDGLIVSPQHIFAHPEHKPGAPPLERKEYWPYGKGDAAVQALAEMMDKALATYRAQAGIPATPTPEGSEGPTPAPDAPVAPPAPDGDAERAAWIAKLLEIVENGPEGARREALRSLVANDRNGDSTTPLIALMPKLEPEKLPALIDVVRILGRPKLDAAAEPIADYLKHKDDLLRANAAVSLEYIGCAESIEPLLARLKRERDDTIASHMYRALGRCGVGEGKVRTHLLKKAEGSKSELAAFGPLVGLAYFEKDEKTARGLEKLLQKLGPPSGGRGGRGNNTMRRALAAWALAEVADPKSGPFVREKLVDPMENMQAWWKAAVVAYFEAIARRCEGDASAADAIDAGIRRTLEFTGGTETLRDEARKERDTSRFTPKAEWDVQANANPFGGRGGGGGR